MHADRWEHGSDFHLSFEAGSAEYPWSSRPHVLFGSGRDALRALLAFLRADGGASRVLCPSYFCQDVVAAMARELPVGVYPNAPHLVGAQATMITARRDDVLLAVSTFGMNEAPHRSSEGITIYDFTHDPVSPEAFATSTHYSVASLRKTLPIPDGGVVWSPRGLPLPPEPSFTADHARAVLDRLSASTLKASYLEGYAVEKDAFCALAIEGERRIGEGPVSGISPFSRARLPAFPTADWRRRRSANLAAFRDALGALAGVTVLDAPFAATLVFETPALRDAVRSALVAARIYPAVLWSLDEPVVAGIPPEHVDLARRILSLHADYRYSPEDMGRVAECVRRAALPR